MPTPKNNTDAILEEDDDEFLRKTAPKSEINKSKNIVKITVPSLSDFNEDDTKEVPRKIFKPTIKSVLLILVLLRTTGKPQLARFVGTVLVGESCYPRKFAGCLEQTYMIFQHGCTYAVSPPFFLFGHANECTCMQCNAHDLNCVN